MCLPAAVAPYAIGGLLGGSLLKKAFGGSKGGNKAPAASPAPMTTAGTVGPPPYGG